jgi:hypothetical protein
MVYGDLIIFAGLQKPSFFVVLYYNTGKDGPSFLVNLGNSCTDIKHENHGICIVLKAIDVRMKNLSAHIFVFFWPVGC